MPNSINILGTVPPINNASVIRSLAAVGCEFQTFGDISLQSTQNINNNQNSELYNYLRQVHNNGPFTTAERKEKKKRERNTRREVHGLVGSFFSLSMEFIRLDLGTVLLE
jgi:hypothetical protein